jgi:hypothetical protein
MGLLIWRTAHEDRTMREELPGYADNTRHTPYRLILGIWLGVSPTDLRLASSTRTHIVVHFDLGWLQLCDHSGIWWIVDDT